MKPITLSLLWLGLFPISLLAQKATLSTSTQTPEVGQVFNLQIEAQGRQVNSPGVLDLPGISVLSQGKSTSISFFNGQMSATTTFNYQVTADDEGPLEIAGIPLTIEGKQVTTNALKLNVRKRGTQGNPPQLQPRLGPGIPTPSPPRSSPRSPGNPGNPPYPSKIDAETAFLKVVPEREEIYVGETVEVEIKACLDAGIPIVNFARELNLEGEDFIFQPTVGPDVQLRRVGNRRAYHFNQEEINGRRFNVLTFRTTITAVKPGDFALAPIDFTAVIQEPRRDRGNARNRRPRSLLDSFLGDPFDDPFFDNVINNRRKELRLQSESVPVKVLPLPAEGRPEDFSGAIGQFSFEVKADKQSLEVDEALKVTATITGHGNFERIGSVAAEEDGDWKSYPPKVGFDSVDDLNLSGEKRFEYTFIAAAPTDRAPLLRFSYFDPEQKGYVRLGGEVVPVTVTGTARTGLSNQDLAALADQAATPEGVSLLRPLTAAAFFHGDASRFLGTGTLLALNGAAAAAALGLVGWQWRRRERPLTPKQRRRQWLKSQAASWSALRESGDAESIDRELLQWLALHERLMQEENAASLDDLEAARLAVQRCPEGSPSRRSLEGYLAWVNARRWSASGATGAECSPEQRADWIEAAGILKEQQPS